MATSVTREYELTVLVHPDAEADQDGALAKIRDIITTAGGEVSHEDNWGKKKMAYKIKRQDFAIYVSYDLNLPGDAPLKISNTLNITDESLRYLLVTTNEKIRAAKQASTKDAATDENQRAESTRDSKEGEE